MFCKHCGKEIPDDAVICTHCGRQVEELKTANSDQPIIINNSASSSASAAASTAYAMPRGKAINKTTALLLCIFLGGFGAHKFYEGKTGMGILYLFTAGLFGIGWIIDIIAILGKPNPYYV